MPASLPRRIRRRFTSGIVHAACGSAPYVPTPLINFAEWSIGRFGGVTPLLAALVRRNMKSAGVYSPYVLRAYFRQAALHLTNGVRVFHFRKSTHQIQEIAAREVELDPTVHDAAAAIKSAGGGILAPAHCTNYLVSLVRLREVIPISIYLRWSKDQRKVDLKRAWCEAAGLDVIIEPHDAANPVGSAMICAEAIRSGKVLAITPDLAQSRDEGTPVNLLNRTAFLPTGPASLAMLCEVPLIPLFSRAVGERQSLYATEPIQVKNLPRSEGGRQEAVRRAMQTWGDGFDSFVRATPHHWYLWADNRWTRVFRDDKKYANEPV